MHMVMVVIADRKRFARLIGVGWWIIVGMVVAVFVDMVSEMCIVAKRMVQRITNVYRRRISGVQREHDGKKENEASAHGEKAYPNTGLV